MKKLTTWWLLLVILAATTVSTSSCQKELTKEEPNTQIISKVNSWLDTKKPPNKAIQASNVELLRSNLDFSKVRIEQYQNGEKIIIIPVNEGLKTEKNLDKEAILNLVTILDKMGNVRGGNIVLFYPKIGETYKTVPENTFRDIYSKGTSMTNGKFKFLSVTGKRSYELEYENGYLKLQGHWKKDSSANNARTTQCIDWFWVYTLRDQYGYVLQTWEEYIGTTCDGEDCQDPYNEMLCPGGGSGGGGGEEEFDLAAESAIISDVYGASSQPAFKSASFSSVEPNVSEVTISWVVVINRFNLWDVRSTDKVKGYNSSNPNIGALIYDIEHLSSGMTGQTEWCRVPRNPGPCIPLVHLSWQETGSSKSIAPTYKSGTVTVSGTLKNMGIGINSYTQYCTVNV